MPNIFIISGISSKNSGKMINNIPVVIVAYDRPRSLNRLLNSIAKANYPNRAVPLVISIDYGETNSDVVQVAREFEWQHGEKSVIVHPENLGLRQHVLLCGNYAVDNGAVIILEDDLVVGPNFYLFASASLNFASDKPYIGGISLYNHQFNVHTRENFSPVEDGYDNWYFQFASSWGQAFTSEQWTNFIKWYKSHTTFVNKEVIPDNVASWSDKSWLKFFIWFLIDHNQYFLYPKISHTTNFSDTGTHISSSSTRFQVPLYHSHRKATNFSTLDESEAVYDAFFENNKLYRYLDIDKGQLCTDLYNCKSKPQERYWLKSSYEPFRVKQSFGMVMKPMDYNIIYHVEGDEIFLYDTAISETWNYNFNSVRRLIYFHKHLSIRDSFVLFWTGIKKRLGHWLNKLT